MEKMEWLALLPALLLGILLGAVYFGLLWLSIRRLVHLQRAALWLLASLLLRMAMLLGALYWLGHDSWQQLLAALAGIILARLLATRYLRSQTGRGVEYGKG